MYHLYLQLIKLLCIVAVPPYRGYYIDYELYKTA